MGPNNMTSRHGLIRPGLARHWPNRTEISVPDHIMKLSQMVKIHIVHLWITQPEPAFSRLVNEPNLGCPQRPEVAYYQRSAPIISTRMKWPGWPQNSNCPTTFQGPFLHPSYNNCFTGLGKKEFHGKESIIFLYFWWTRFAPDYLQCCLSEGFGIQMIYKKVSFRLKLRFNKNSAWI